MIEDIYELSPIQKGMLFHALSEPQSCAYLSQLSCALSGNLRAGEFRQAWQALVDRQPVLRTSFHAHSLDKPVQVVRRAAALPWTFEDWRGTRREEQQQRWSECLRLDRKTALRLDQAPLMRCRLVQTGDAEFRFCWTHHHLLMDGWCLSIVLGELFHLYRQLSERDSPALPPAPAYRDFILWLQRQDSGRARGFWQQHLGGFQGPTLLPDRAGPETGSVAEARVTVTPPAGLRDRMRAFAGRHQLTLNAIVQGAWALLLSRYYSETDVVFGATVAGRPPELAGIESMLGVFINTVPIRAHVDPQADLLPWLKSLQALQALRSPYEYAALSDIRQWSGVAGNLPLFETNIIFMNYPLDRSFERNAGGWEVSDVELYDRTDIPLTLQVTPADPWQIELLYDDRRFDRATISRMGGHFVQLLEEFEAHPEQRLGQYRIVTAAEKQQLLEVFNNTKTEFDAGRTFIERFEEGAAAHPERVALRREGREVSYRELNERANRLARFFRSSAGLGSGDLAAVALDRSERMAQSILAIWKCGAAYIPIEPRYPQERIWAILDEARPKLVLAQTDWDRTEAESSGYEASDLGISVRPGDLAYVIFTSGSTGKPKGVMIEHAGMLNHLLAKVDDFEITSESIIAQNASHCFDVSVWQFFAALLKGGTTVIYGDAVVLDPDALRNRIQLDRVTILEVVPSYLAALLSRLEPADALPAMTYLAVTGEIVKPQLIEAWFRRFPSIPVVNAYGPTEASDDIAHCKMYRLPETASIPLGRPIRNTHIYIVDEQGNLCPTGIKGEIWVSGTGVGRGYLDDPLKTSLAFCEDPFRTERGVRMYRTGDLGCWTADGNVLLFGRKDHQVKIRGHRIELGEVEAALSAVEGVEDAAVLDRRDDGRETYLCAYVTVEHGRKWDPEYLANRLTRILPEYMIPSFFVSMARLPLTANGKLDRKALPAPDRLTQARSAGYAPPRNATEAVLCRIWSEALNVGNPGIHDSFFALGGDSIIAMQIVARASREGFRLVPKQIFQHPTVAELAVAAERPDSSRPAMTPPAGPSPLTPVQRRFFSQKKVDPHYYNQSVLMEVPSGIDQERLQLAIDAAVERQEALRWRFREKDGVWAQDVAPDKRAELTTYHVTAADFAALAEELHSSLDLANGPLFRAGLFRFGAGQAARLLLVVHHLAIDAVSWGILIEDIYVAYRGKTEPANLPPGTAPYRQWADRLETHARSGAPAAELDRWLGIGTAETKPLPVDRAPVPDGNRVGEAGEVSLELNDSITRALLHESSRAYHTRIDDLLLSALVLAFRDWTGEDTLLLELEGHGRDHPAIDLDVTRTVGWFTSIFPVVLRAAPSLPDTIKAVKEQLRAVPNRGANWGLLRYGSAGDSTRQRLESLPAAEVLVNYFGQTDQALPSGFEWKVLTESGGGRSPRQRRDHLLEINALVSGGRLRVHWTYGRGVHDRETIIRLAESFNNYLERIADHCSAAEVYTLTPSDVPAARISQQALDVLAANVAGDLEDVYELTPAQQGMLFHTIYEPASGAYVNQLTCRIEGALDERVFREAWCTAMARHRALRTSYHWQGIDKPVQAVLRSVDLPWHFEDLQGLSANLSSRFDRDREIRFELTRAPLMRLGLLRTGEHEWHFHWTQHHLLLDGWSSALVLNEVVQAYEALALGHVPRFAPLRPFRDHVLWLQAQDSKRAGRFWREELDGFRAPTPLVLGRPEMEGAARPGKIAEEETLLPEALGMSAAAAAQEAGITLSTLAQGAWALLLSRYSGESDVVCGYVVSGRPPGLAGSDEMAGMFINVLPARVRLDPFLPAVEWLRGIQTKTAERDEFSWCGLTEIQGWSSVPAGAPLFESLLIFENYPVEESLKRGTASLRIHDVRAVEPNNYALTLVVTPEGTGISLKAMYDDGRFDRATVQRLLGHYRQILTSMAAELAAPIGGIEVLTAEERRTLGEWNATDHGGAPEQTLVDSFQHWVAKEPGRVAVRSGRTSFTYGELDDRSDSLAACLAATVEIHAEDRIAILMDRSERLLESILAVWKTGAAYVPVDPAYPTERIRLILEKARPSAVIAGQLPPELAAAVPSGIPLVSWNGTPAAGRRPLTPHRSVPAGLAYVIFTSGSTGVPKGAMVEHRGMFNHIVSMVGDLGLGPSSRVAQTASHCFDISVWQLFAPLMSGGETVIYSDGIIADARALARSFEADAISHAQFVPSYLSAFLEELEAWPEQRLSRLQWMVTIGETLKPGVVQRWFARFPGVRLMNAYGPTEASDSITHFAMERTPAMASIPIGRPIRNTRIYILDPLSNLCPIGVKGEICVSGTAVGRGYLFDAERSAAVFQPDSFHDGCRRYRTGDIGCYAPDGNILFFGRRDSQVKIRGHRIELGEIETALAALEHVAEAAVVAREEHGLLSLTAYIVGRDNGSCVNAGGIQAALSRKLPDYMVPEAVVVLDSLPKTSNGKVDRKALPAAIPMPASDADAPGTAAESELVRIWCSVLGRDRIGVNDRFFEIGGHSLRAIQLVSRIRSEMQSEVTIRDVFECPSIRELARRINGASRPSSAVISLAPPRPWYPASHTQKRIWLASRTPEGSAAHNMASALRIAGDLRHDALTRALDALVERHESLRTVFAQKQGEIVQVVRGAKECGFRMKTSDCSDNEEQAAALREEESLLPFDLQNGPLFRATLARLSPRTHLLLLTLHHIVADAWSARVLLRELATLYGSFAAGQANPLPPQPLQFKDYATWQKQQADSGEMKAHRDYWLGQLSRDMPRLKLATDFPGSERPTFEAGRVTVTVPRNLSLGLAEIAQRSCTTLYAVVLSGVFVLLHRHTGQEDLVIGSQAASRERGELEGQVGSYLNTVVLRQRIVPGQTVDQVVQTTSRMLMESLEHQSYPFDLLVEDLRAPRLKGRPPLFDVQADHVPSTTFGAGPFIAPGVEVEDVSGDGGFAKYDLSFFTSDEPKTGLRIVLEYNRALFQEQTIQTMGENLQEILTAFGGSPERAVVPDVPARKTLRVGLRL